jgi:uncharacterized membrane protein
MKHFLKHLKTNMIRGLLAIIPLILSYFAVNFIYVVIDKRVMGWIDQFIGFPIPGLGLILVLIILYVLGIVASNVIGKEFFNIIERLTNRIPIIKTAYQVGKQIATTFSLPESQVFKQVILVDYFKPDAWMIGFVTGSIVNNETNEQFLKVFLPTVPNPTSGFLVFIKENQMRTTTWTVEEGMRAIISGGIIGPEEIK